MRFAQGTQRRVAALAVVGTVAGAWASALGGGGGGLTEPASAARSPVVESPPVAAAYRGKRCPFPTALRPAFERAARDTGLPPALLFAVAKIESRFSPDARSEAGARGVLQLLPATGASLALNIDDPEANILAGARYLRQLIGRFKATDLAIAAYNAGPTAVERAAGAPSGSVVTYVANVNLQWRSVAGCR